MSQEEEEGEEISELEVPVEVKEVPQSGHCFKCKKTTLFENHILSESKNHRSRLSGNCSECKKPVSKFVKKK